MKVIIRIISFVLVFILSCFNMVMAENLPTIETQFRKYEHIAYNTQTLNTWISFPNHVRKFDEIEITVLELLGDQNSLYTTYTCEFNIPDAHLCYWSGFENELKEVDLYPEKPVYYVSVLPCVNGYEPDYFSNAYPREGAWQEVTFTIFPERFHMRSEQWITIDFEIKIAKVYAGEWSRKEVSLSLDYQLTPTLDSCQFPDILKMEEFNLQLGPMTIQSTAVALTIWDQVSLLDPKGPNNYGINYLYMNWNHCLHEYLSTLPDAFYIAVYDENEMKFYMAYLLVRNGDQYIYSGKYNFLSEECLKPSSK